MVLTIIVNCTDYHFRLVIVAKLTEIRSIFRSSHYSGADGVQLFVALLSARIYALLIITEEQILIRFWGFRGLVLSLECLYS